MNINQEMEVLVMTLQVIADEIRGLLKEDPDQLEGRSLLEQLAARLEDRSRALGEELARGPL